MFAFSKLFYIKKEAAVLPLGTRRFSYSSQAAYTHLTVQLGLRPQTGTPSDAASLLVLTENQLSFRRADPRPHCKNQKQEKCTTG